MSTAERVKLRIQEVKKANFQAHVEDCKLPKRIKFTNLAYLNYKKTKKGYIIKL